MWIKREDKSDSCQPGTRVNWSCKGRGTEVEINFSILFTVKFKEILKSYLFVCKVVGRKINKIVQVLFILFVLNVRDEGWSKMYGTYFVEWEGNLLYCR